MVSLLSPCCPYVTASSGPSSVMATGMRVSTPPGVYCVLPLALALLATIRFTWSRSAGAVRW